MSELYHVVVLRRGMASQRQLNYTTETAAKAAMTRLCAGAPTDIAGRITLEDSFGSMIAFESADIGDVMFIDAERVLEMRKISSLMEARAQADANRQAVRDPALARNGLLVAAAGAIPDGRFQG